MGTYTEHASHVQQRTDTHTVMRTCFCLMYWYLVDFSMGLTKTWSPQIDSRFPEPSAAFETLPATPKSIQESLIASIETTRFRQKSFHLPPAPPKSCCSSPSCFFDERAAAVLQAPPGLVARAKNQRSGRGGQAVRRG